ncbi:MAG TPA: CpsB/CapC family capsule biosynthesis tyrosine phosphatase [Solirubrobacteraceae bacterium]
MSYSEIHFHILDGVDDGPGTLDESVELARLALADGTRTIVATPHVHRRHVTDPAEISDRVARLNDRLRQERVPVDVLAGGELAHDMVGRLDQRRLDAIAQGPHGRRWVLLEAAFEGLEQSYTQAADELRERGFAVVVAHPERAAQSRRTQEVLAHELAEGSALQLTAWSLTGRYGDAIRALALRLLRSTAVAVIASDAHGVHRAPSLGPALTAVAAVGEANPARFAGTKPRALLNRGLAIPTAARAA